MLRRNDDLESKASLHISYPEYFRKELQGVKNEKRWRRKAFYENRLSPAPLKSNDSLLTYQENEKVDQTQVKVN